MHPVTERFLLIERLDNIMLWALFAYVAVGFTVHFLCRRYKYEKLNNYLHFADALAFLAVIGYLYWRTFLAWKGIYYP